MRNRFLSNKTRGFTLLEMAMVLGIMGIIFAVAYPNLEIAKRHNALNAEALAVKAEIKYISQLAVDEGVNYRLYFNQTQKKCIVRKAGDMTNLKEHIFENGINFDSSNSSALIVLGSEEYLEVIGGKGIVDSGTQSVISLKNLDGVLIKVRVFQGRKIDISWE